MRPPLFAGEDVLADDDALAMLAASMRPPLFAGEDATVSASAPGVRRASMRPPLFAGEDTLRLRGVRYINRALQ